ncbi:MAG: hypothetical protein QXF14_02225 [Candidatus Woesearchaeota archaeon]
MTVVAAEIQEGIDFLDAVLGIDLERLEAELARLKGINFKDVFASRAPYKPRYSSPFGFTKNADTALKLVSALVNEFVMLVDTYNRYNQNNYFMECFLETSLSIPRVRVLNGGRAKKLYDSGQVIMNYRHLLAEFLRSRNFLRELDHINRKEHLVLCRVIPVKNEWWTTF